MAKLYKVTCILTYLAVEEDEESARENAITYAREHLGDATNPFDYVTVDTVDSIEKVPEGWLNAIPYGDAGDGNTRVATYIPAP